METGRKSGVIAISSFVARGGVGLRATGFALERLGHRVWMVPTIFLPWHLGHGRSTKLLPSAAEFRAALDELAEARWLHEVGAILTGFFGDPAQVEAVGAFIDLVRAKHPDVVVQVDPVSGDEGHLYVSAETLAAIRAHLVPRADIATPNRFELSYLTDLPTDRTEAIVAAARTLGPPEVVVTSAPASRGGAIATLLVDRETVVEAEHTYVGGAPHGVGDLFGALFLHWRMSGLDDRRALYRATGATCEMVARSVEAGSEELLLAEAQEIFARPATRVTVREVRDDADGGERRVLGIDGCQNGWVGVIIRREHPFEPELVVTRSFAEMLNLPMAPEVIAVDMPIGLPESISGTGRDPEQAVRPLLGERQSSVFSIPARSAVMAHTFAEACAAALATSSPARKVSRQSFALFQKIREIDALMTPALAGRVFEAHPEVAFWRLNNGRPLATPKKVKGRIHEPGMSERMTLLLEEGYPEAFFEQALPPGVGLDDVIDAAAVALVARRIARGEAVPYPDPPPRDARGLPMAIWA